MKFTLNEMNGLLNGKCLPSDLLVGETLAEYLVRQFCNLNEQLAESHRALAALAAEVYDLKHPGTYLPSKRDTPALDAFLAEVRASAIPEGYVLVPQEMHLSSEAMEGICFHCGDGGHQFGEFTDGTLFVGEVDYGDALVYGLHIATADYPDEGCATICEFAAQLSESKGVQS